MLLAVAFHRHSWAHSRKHALGKLSRLLELAKLPYQMQEVITFFFFLSQCYVTSSIAIAFHCTSGEKQWAQIHVREAVKEYPLEVNDNKYAGIG